MNVGLLNACMSLTNCDDIALMITQIYGNNQLLALTTKDKEDADHTDHTQSVII